MSLMWKAHSNADRSLDRASRTFDRFASTCSLCPPEREGGDPQRQDEPRDRGRDQGPVPLRPAQRALDEARSTRADRAAVQEPTQSRRPGRVPSHNGRLGSLSIAFRTIVSRSFGTVGAIARGAKRFLVEDAVQQRRAIARLEGGAQGQGLIERRAQAIDVGADIARARLAADLLGAHVPQGAHQISRARQPASSRVMRARPKSVTHSLSSASTIRFDGLMSRWMTPRRMCVFQRLGRLHAEAGHGRGRRGDGAMFGPEARGARASLSGPPRIVPEDLGQRSSLDQGHGVERSAPLEADCEDGDDIRVVQAGGRLGLDAEALKGARVERRGAGEDLERHSPLGWAELLGLVDDPMPPRPTSRRMRKSPRTSPCSSGDSVGFRPTCRRQLSGHRLEQIQGVEALGQLAGNVSVFGQERLAVDVGPERKAS